MLSSMESGVNVVFEKAQHVVAPDVIQRAALHGLDRQLVPSAGNHRVQAQNFTRLRDSDHQGLSLAENKNSARTLSFDKNHRMFRENRGMFYLVERFDGLLGEIAETTAGTQMAIQTAFNAVQSGHTHWRSSISHKNTFAPVLAGND